MAEEGAYTYEARDLWTVRSPDRRLVGVDAKGIQLRVLAHYLNNKSFTEAILAEDPHSANRDAWGFPEGKQGRALAKTIIYATIMGAGDARIAAEAKISKKEAKEAKDLFFDRVPELPKLINRLKGEYNRDGRITLCDGSRIIPRRDYMVIPGLLQGDESRIMKKAAILSAVEIYKRELDVLKVGDIHDEWQSDTHVRCVEELTTDLYPTAFRCSGEYFNYNLPIDCDSKVGLTWAETH
jgi:DNA polymerase-1